jgi:hypothetical protein
LILYEYLRVAARQGRSWARRVAPLLACCLLWQATINAGAQENRRVLVLYDRGRSAPAVAVVDREIREAFEKQTTYHIIPATQSLPMVVGVANAPIFVLADVLVVRGAVGGYVSSYASQGRIAAEDVLKILGGEKPQSIPVERICDRIHSRRRNEHTGLRSRSSGCGPALERMNNRLVRAI